MFEKPLKRTVYPSGSRPLLTIAILVFLIGSAKPASPLSFVLTADTEGQLGPCRDCTGGQGLGDMARRATLVKGLREKDPSLLLVDAGNALFGAESLESQGRVIVAAYNTLRYDAVNLSHRDFQFGKAFTLALLKEANFSVLSTNLLDDKTGKLLAKPYVIKQVGRQKIALIGVTQSPAGLDTLPHLKEQFSGIRIQSPVEALAHWAKRFELSLNGDCCS